MEVLTLTTFYCGTNSCCTRTQVHAPWRADLTMKPGGSWTSSVGTVRSRMAASPNRRSRRGRMGAEQRWANLRRPAARLKHDQTWSEPMSVLLRLCARHLLPSPPPPPPQPASSKATGAKQGKMSSWCPDLLEAGAAASLHAGWSRNHLLVSVSVNNT